MAIASSRRRHFSVRGSVRAVTRLWQIALLAMCVVGSVESAAADDFANANQLYDQGKFLEARQQYGAIAERGEWSANLFYNLGNANFRLGAPGLAALNYERALALDRAHPEAAMNLQLVRDRTGARFPAPSWSDRLGLRSSTNMLAVGGAAAVWFGVFCFVRILTRRGRNSALAWVGLLASIVTAALLGAALWHREQDAALAVVTASEAQARLAPADRAGVAEGLPAGSRVRVLSERGEWTYCVLPGGGRGWLPAGTLEKVRLSQS